MISEEYEEKGEVATATLFKHHVFPRWFLRRMQEREVPTAAATATLFKHHVFCRWFLRRMQEREEPTEAATATLFKHHVFCRWSLRRMQEREGPTAAATAIPSFFSTLPHSTLKTSGFWTYLLATLCEYFFGFGRAYYPWMKEAPWYYRSCIHQLSVNKLDNILACFNPPPHSAHTHTQK